MEFGRIYELVETVDFTLPPDTETTLNTLKMKGSPGELRIYVGAPKWAEKSWLGKIYPKKVADNEYLRYYAQNFNTIEFGATFYTIQELDKIKRWTDQVADSPDFKFCPKFPQMVSHIRRLANAQEETDRFYNTLQGFGNHLGPMLLQLGDNFSPKSFPQLKAYVEALPLTHKVCIEVRNKEWFANKHQRHDLLQLFYDNNIGTVISDTSGRRDCVHVDLTTTDAFIRFVGNNLADSDYKRMDDWVERFKVWANLGLKSIWLFMHQNDERYVPKACIYLIKQLNEKLGTSLKAPTIIGN